MRIVSLIASATEMVHALGLGACQVGRSHECDYPAEVSTLPLCTRPRFEVEGSAKEVDQRVRAALGDAASVYEVFDDVIERLQPDVILTQSQCRVCAVSREDVEAALAGRFGGHPRTVVALEPYSLECIWEDIRRVASACGVSGAGDELVARLQRDMDSYRGAGGGARVAVIEWQEPLMAAGHWTPELVELVGAVNVDSADLSAADPDVIVVAPCGYGLEKTISEMHWLTERPEWPGLRAVREGRVYLADGNAYFNRPGPRVVQAVRILAEILRDERDSGEGWMRFQPSSALPAIQK
ncbi:MAG: cobalamin-binding protein [Bryobacteraceae bacterium]|nr:cobalamin-binding protein [Bryobacteraceae bacterium]